MKTFFFSFRFGMTSALCRQRVCSQRGSAWDSGDVALMMICERKRKLPRFLFALASWPSVGIMIYNLCIMTVCSKIAEIHFGSGESMRCVLKRSGAKLLYSVFHHAICGTPL